ncbi:MAG: methionine gamma-lyase family protein, partial [Anaerovoracaceae bacterium]|nr:methionine gamma-lyase family protein [Anaerovoracaceae bacterium]
MDNTTELLTGSMGISPVAVDIVNKAENEVSAQFEKLNDITAYNQYKVLKAMQKYRLSDTHFSWNTGYGYDDAGREITEKIFAEVFGAQSALVRTQIVNGTHALSLA